MKYTVLAEQNARFDDGDRLPVGEFDAAEAALAAARRIIDDFLLGAYRPGMEADALFELFTTFGEDAYIVSDDPELEFSGWDYARVRARDIALLA